jgi:aminotransferase
MKRHEEHTRDIAGLVSSTARDLPPSGIREFFDIVYSTPDCISLGVGEPDFITPWRISESGIFAIQEGYTHYTPNRGIPELLMLTAQYLAQRYSTHYNPLKEIVMTMGVSQGLDLALRSIINPGDEVIIIEPCYVSYAANVNVLHGTPVIISALFEDDFKIRASRIKEALTPRTKAIILNYPANPTGVSLDRGTLQEIADLAMERNLIVISDEIYCALNFTGEHYSITRIPGMKERTIYLNGFSKSHAMTGWRLGYVAGPEFIMDIVLKLVQYTALCASSIAQHAAIEALTKGDRDVEKMRAEYERRRNYMVHRFNDIGLACLNPDGAFYVFPRIASTGLDSRQFALGLLDRKKVAVVPGNVFGKSGEGHIRCSFATSMENLKESMKRIEEYTGELK